MTESEIELRSNPICSVCGAKGLGYPKTGFAVIYNHILKEKLTVGNEWMADGLCVECAKHREILEKTKNIVGLPRMVWHKKVN